MISDKIFAETISL